MQGLVGAYLVPLGLAAVGIDFANECHAVAIRAAGTVMGLAATAHTSATVIGAGFAGLGVAADPIAADIRHRARTAIKAFDFVDAKLIPVHIAAVGVLCTDAGFDGLVIAPLIAVDGTAGAIAGIALVGFLGAEPVPLDIAAEGVHCADTALDIVIDAAFSSVGQAAAPRAISTVRRTIDTVLVVTTDVVATGLGAGTAVGGAGFARLTQQRLTGIIPAALAAVGGAGLAVLVVVAHIVATFGNHITDTALQVGHLSHAQTIPGDVAAEGIGRTDTDFNLFILAAGRGMAATTIAIAGTALIRLRRTDFVPHDFAAEGIGRTDTALHFEIGTAGGIAWQAATALTWAAVNSAVGAAFPFATHLVATGIGAVAAVSRAAFTGFAQQSFAGVIAAALAAVGGAGLAVFVVITRIIATKSAGTAVFRAELAAFQLATDGIATGITGTAVLGAAIAGFRLVTNAIAALLYEATNTAAKFLDFANADIIPGGFAAIGIQFTDTGLDGRVFTARDIQCVAAEHRTRAAVVGTRLTVLGPLANGVAAIGTFPAVSRAALTVFRVVTQGVTASPAAKQAALSNGLFNADVIPNRLTAERVQCTGTGLNGLVRAARPLLDSATIAANSTVIGAGLAAFVGITGRVAAITADVLAAQADTVDAHVPAGADITVITRDIHERRVDAAAGGITGILGAGVTIVTIRGRANALAVGAHIHVGADITIITGSTVRFGADLASARIGGTATHLALAQSHLGTGHCRRGVDGALALQAGQGTGTEVPAIKLGAVGIHSTITHIVTRNAHSLLAVVSHGTGLVV